MAQDCYTLFKSVYNQAIADGLGTAVATGAAQSAMEDCLRKQATVTPATTQIVNVPGSTHPDPGPTSGGSIEGSERGDGLGTIRNKPKKER